MKLTTSQLKKLKRNRSKRKRQIAETRIEIRVFILRKRNGDIKTFIKADFI